MADVKAKLKGLSDACMHGVGSLLVMSVKNYVLFGAN
jgi:hypothetical protein